MSLRVKEVKNARTKNIDGYKIYEFTTIGESSVTFSGSGTIDLLVVGGGGSSFYEWLKWGTSTLRKNIYYGGAGGFIEIFNYPISAGTYKITVGSGGTIQPTVSGSTTTIGNNNAGTSSSFGVIGAGGGGGGGLNKDNNGKNYNSIPNVTHGCGGSGGYTNTTANDTIGLYNAGTSNTDFTNIKKEDVKFGCNNAIGNYAGGAGSNGEGIRSSIINEMCSVALSNNKNEGSYGTNGNYNKTNPNFGAAGSWNQVGKDGIVAFRISKGQNELVVDVLPDNLIVYYPFDSNCIESGDINGANQFDVANVASGIREYDAIVKNGEIATIEGGYKTGDGALALNGYTIFSIKPNFSTAIDGFTISFFFNLPSDQKDSNGNIVYNKSNSFLCNGPISFSCNGVLKTNTSSSSIEISNFSQYKDGDWHHFAWALSKKNIWLAFIDGEVVSYYTSSFNIYPNLIDSEIEIGKEMYGLIDDFRIYNYPLQPRSIRELQNTTTSFTFIETSSVSTPTPTESIVQLQNQKAISYENPFTTNTESFTTPFYIEGRKEEKMRIINLSIGICISIGYLYYLVK